MNSFLNMRHLRNLISILSTPLFLLVCGLVLAFSLRGIKGNPNEFELLTDKWRINGPFELSPDRGRFALTFSIVKNNSLSFSLPLAKFATPDLGYINNNYVSLFDPGVSFIVIPGYWIGNYFGISQVGAFATISIFALLNVFLIIKILQLYKVNKLISYLASLAFLFGSPAFSYGVTLYQHHVTTFIILLSIYLLIKFESFFSLLIIWFLIALSVSIDYPNMVLMFPIIMAIIGKMFLVDKHEHKIFLKIKFINIFSVLGILLPLAFFFWFNKTSYGNPLQLASTVPTITSINDGNNQKLSEIVSSGNPVDLLNQNNYTKSAINFFKTRNLLNGLYILFLSPDRGLLYYAPVLALGVVGFYVAYKRRYKYVPTMVLILGLNVLLYAMWGDPWGGWAFGSRYLVPSYAILAIFLAIGLNEYKNNWRILLLFIFLFCYSLMINTAGALTTNALPPKVEVLNLEKLSKETQKYTYSKNFDLLNSNESKSYVFQNYFKDKINSKQYFEIIFLTIFTISLLISAGVFFNGKKIFIKKPSFSLIPLKLKINFVSLRRRYESIHK